MLKNSENPWPGHLFDAEEALRKSPTARHMNHLIEAIRTVVAVEVTGPATGEAGTPDLHVRQGGLDPLPLDPFSFERRGVRHLTGFVRTGHVVITTDGANGALVPLEDLPLPFLLATSSLLMAILYPHFELH